MKPIETLIFNIVNILTIINPNILTYNHVNLNRENKRKFKK